MQIAAIICEKIMSLNNIEKKRSALRALGIISLIFGLGAVVGGIFMIISGVTNIGTSNQTTGIILLVFCIILAILSVLAVIWGVYATWVGFSIKATRGTIAEDDEAKGSQNTKRCPKCGAINTANSTECQVCHTPLE